jgi:hypothetical protein
MKLFALSDNIAGMARNEARLMIVKTSKVGQAVRHEAVDCEESVRCR